MKGDAVISVSCLGKRYQIGRVQNGPREGFRHALDGWATAPFRMLKSAFDSKDSANLPRRAKSLEPFWALKDVSFELKRGEVVGIIGRNGAGKSTLLKILSRITEPTEGRVRLKGRVASLLEVGTGFHGELTGRENIFLNGAILGMRRLEIKSKLDEIVAFSEVEEFLDTPVKRYSSGMYVRLAFAVAAHLEPDILVVDEVLAVGDAAFQKKCLGKMKDVAGEGRTILFVSHNSEAVRNLCQRAIWLKGGSLHHDGAADDVIDSYLSNISGGRSFSHTNSAYGFAVQKVVLKNSDGQETRQFRPGEDLICEISYDARISIEQPYIVVGVIGGFGACFTANMLLDGARPKVLEGTGTITCRFKSIPLLPQSYMVNMAVRTANAHDFIVDYQEVASFSVSADLAQYGYKGEFRERASRYTPVVVPYEWGLPDGTQISVSLAEPREDALGVPSDAGMTHGID